MTTAMRAAAGSAPCGRALRVALARGGRVEREWLLDVGELTVGQSEAADVVTTEVAFDRRVLVRVGPTGATLFLPPLARGRVHSPSGALLLDGTSATPLALDEGTRGRVVFGEGEHQVALLFQRIDAPPKRATPQLPRAMQQGLLDRVDWFFTAVAAASFMLHFAGIVALSQADWPLDARVADLDARTAEILFAEETLPPELSEHANDPPDAELDAIAEAPVVETPAPSHAPRPTAPTSARLEDIDAQVDLAVEQVLGALGSHGAFADLVRDGAPTVDAATLLASVDGTTPVALHDPGALDSRDSDATPSSSLTDLRRVSVSTEQRQEGREPVRERAVRVMLDPNEDELVSIDTNWDERLLRAQIQRRMHAIQRCYETELTRSPELAGRVTVSMRVEEIGTLSRVHVEDDTTGSRSLGDCVVNQIRTIRLVTGPAGGALIEYPVVFAPQR